MIRRLIILACFVFGSFLGLHAQMTSNVWERVLYIRVGGGNAGAVIGTAFTYEQNGRQYILTAKHMVASLGETGTIEYDKAEKWTPLTVKILRCDDPVIIAVLVAPQVLTTTFDFKADASKISYGQDVYFLGFPLGIFLNGTNVNGDLPLPFIKRGTYTGTRVLDAQKKAVQILLDGYNNHGFSGGPIVYRDALSGQFEYKLLGVISSFIPETGDVYDKEPVKSLGGFSKKAEAEAWRKGQNPDGTFYELKENGRAVSLNTGIVVGTAIFPALDLISANPIGPMISQAK